MGIATNRVHTSILVRLKAGAEGPRQDLALELSKAWKKCKVCLRRLELSNFQQAQAKCIGCNNDSRSLLLLANTRN